MPAYDARARVVSGHVHKALHSHVHSQVHSLYENGTIGRRTRVSSVSLPRPESSSFSRAPTGRATMVSERRDAPSVLPAVARPASSYEPVDYAGSSG